MNPQKETNQNRRKFIKRGLSAGAVAGGALLLGDKGALANTLMGMSKPQWQVTVDGKIVKEGNFPKENRGFFYSCKKWKSPHCRG